MDVSIPPHLAVLRRNVLDKALLRQPSQDGYSRFFDRLLLYSLHSPQSHTVK